MKRSRRAPAPRRPLLAVEQLEDRAVPATFSFGGFTFEQDSTPDVRSVLAPGTYNGAVVTAAPTTATGTVSGFPSSTSGFNSSLAMGTLIDATNPPRALNLPAGNDGTTARSGVLLSWSGGKGIVNATGDDLVIYEIGFPGAPEAFMMQVHNATTGQWSNWYYEPADSFTQFGSGGDGAFATSIGLGSLGISSGHIIDAIRIVNMTDEDRMFNSSGSGRVLPEDNGATSTFLPNPGPLSSSTTYGATTLDPSPLYVGAFHALTTPLVDVQVTKTNNVTNVSPGSPVTYTIVVNNAGPNAATGTAFTDNLPTSLSNVTWTSSASGGATGNAANGSGNISETLNLPVGASVTYTITGTLSASATGTLTNTATATVSAAVTDADTRDNSATDTDNIGATSSSVDISVTKTNNQKFVVRNLDTTYTIVVSNVGSTTALDVNVVDNLPAGFSAGTWTSVSSGGATGSAGSGSGSINELLALPAGASVTYTLTATVSNTASGGLTNTVTATPQSGVTDSNTANNTASDRDTVLPKPVPAFANQFSVGADEGANGHVKVFNPDGSLRFSFIAFAGFNGGVRVATGDVNGDGVDDIAVGAGFGAGNGHIKVFDGETGALITSFFSFESFLGGVDVAIGDVNGDGFGDLIVGSGPGGAHVKVFSLASGTPTELASFLTHPDFNGGITVTAGDINGDGRAEIITGTATGAAHVKAFSLTTSGAISEVASFLAYSGFAGGIDVAAADLRNNDGLAELLVSPLSRGAGEQVLLFSLSGAPTIIGSFTPSFPGAERGLRLATGDVDNDGDDDIIIAGGPGRGAKVKAFDALSFAELRDFAAFDAFQGGVFVG